MSIHRIITLLAILQGSFVIGFTTYVFFYYVPKKGKDDLRKHILTIAASYNLLTMSSIITIALHFYIWGDWWYWLIGLAYLLGDISLYYVFKHTVKKEKDI